MVSEKKPVVKKVAQKPKVSESKPKDKEVKETKSEAFLRLGKIRTEKVLKALRILSNCSNRSNYEYTSEQIESIFSTIQATLNLIEAKFTPSKREVETFNF